MTNPLADYTTVRSARDQQLDDRRRRAATWALAGMCRDADDFRELAEMLGLDAAEARA